MSSESAAGLPRGRLQGGQAPLKGAPGSRGRHSSRPSLRRDVPAQISQAVRQHARTRHWLLVRCEQSH